MVVRVDDLNGIGFMTVAEREMALALVLCGARWLIGRMPDSQSREPGFESPLIPFRSLGIFFHFTTPQSIQLYK